MRASSAPCPTISSVAASTGGRIATILTGPKDGSEQIPKEASGPRCSYGNRDRRRQQTGVECCCDVIAGTTPASPRSRVTYTAIATTVDDGDLDGLCPRRLIPGVSPCRGKRLHVWAVLFERVQSTF